MKAYGKLSTEFYDLDKPHPTEIMFNFYLASARQSGGPILEPMCGSGRFLLPLLAQGFDITGVDSSPEMLAACWRRAAQQSLNPELYKQRLNQLNLPRKYQLAMIPGGSFGLLTDPAEALESLRRIMASLVPGGLFVLDIDQLDSNPELVSGEGERSVKRPDGTKILLRTSATFNPDESISYGVNRYDLVKNGIVVQTEVETFNLRYYTPELFSKLLLEAGFTHIQYQVGFTPHEPQPDTLVFICQRPADNR